MKRNTRSQTKLKLARETPLNLPDDLPAPSTSRILGPRSRATSLARSASRSTSGSRGSSLSRESSVSGSRLGGWRSLLEAQLASPGGTIQASTDAFTNTANLTIGPGNNQLGPFAAPLNLDNDNSVGKRISQATRDPSSVQSSSSTDVPLGQQTHGSMLLDRGEVSQGRTSMLEETADMDYHRDPLVAKDMPARQQTYELVSTRVGPCDPVQDHSLPRGSSPSGSRLGDLRSPPDCSLSESQPASGTIQPGTDTLTDTANLMMNGPGNNQSDPFAGPSDDDSSIGNSHPLATRYPSSVQSFPTDMPRGQQTDDSHMPSDRGESSLGRMSMFGETADIVNNRDPLVSKDMPARKQTYDPVGTHTGLSDSIQDRTSAVGETANTNMDWEHFAQWESLLDPSMRPAPSGENETYRTQTQDSSADPSNSPTPSSEYNTGPANFQILGQWQPLTGPPLFPSVAGYWNEASNSSSARELDFGGPSGSGIGSGSTSSKRKRPPEVESTSYSSQHHFSPPFPTNSMSSPQRSWHMDSDNEVAEQLLFSDSHSSSQSLVLGGEPEPSSQGRKGKDRKGKARARTPRSPAPVDSDAVIVIPDTPPSASTKSLATSAAAVEEDPDAGKTSSKKPPADPLSSYTCPICFSPPTNATLTPCGHICCGACLFAAVKATLQRAALSGMGGAQDGLGEARCPVCRATIPGWDGKGGGVIGLKARAIFSL